MDDIPQWRRLLASPPLWLRHDLLGAARATDLCGSLDRELEWQRPRLTLFGRTHPIPRQQVWMGDADARYRYSGRDFAPCPWHPLVSALRRHIEEVLRDIGLRAHFNSVLLNRYADGEDRMGWHSDDEPELGAEPLIAAVSLGDERPLRFRWRDARAPAFNVMLPHDSLLVMGPGTQGQLQHAVLPRRRGNLRISLTFRHVNVPPGRERQ